ncbi:pitrilysin family protein [Pseudomonas entomophila]|uniref:M16 family metallopeptidase n=1 Tax=Pseudomonas entomophila TaxID=312306 RepID=UPI0023D85EB1|nr:pitrilysin family protein [Pseudomonas entomophila]MDF0734087.1 pitrilysin family protein [Pseudomonas entomophila]
MNDLTRTDTTHLANPTLNSPVEQLTSAQGLDLTTLEPVRTPVQSWETEAGTRVLFVPSRELPIVDLVLDFKAGRALEGETPGLAALVLYLLDEGTQTLDANLFAERLDELGALIDKRVRPEHVTLNLRSLSDHDVLAPAVELLTDMVAHPAFHPSAVARVKQQLLAHQAAQETGATTRARNEAFRHLFAGHPYAHALNGSQDGVNAITPDQLRAFHQRAYSANNLQVSLVGDLSRQQAEALVEGLTQALPQHWAAADTPAVPAAEPEIIHIEQPGTSDRVLLAMPFQMQPDAPDYLALVLASEILGTGLESRLMRELRQRRGLTYDVRAQLVSLSAAGVLAIEWEIAAHYNAAAQDLVADIVRQFVEQGPSAAELALARQQLAGALLRAVARNHSLAGLLGDLGRQGLPADHVSSYVERLANLTEQDIKRALQCLELQAMVFVSVGPDASQQPLPEQPVTDQ